MGVVRRQVTDVVRIIDRHSHRLQLQERLCDEVADDLARSSGSPDVAVWAQGEHLCMSMRGVRAAGARTVTERGRLSTDTALAARILTAAGIGRQSDERESWRSAG